LLDISVETGESGPVVRVSGEADLSVAGQLGDALNAQISGGVRHLTVDLSGLRFADSAAVRTLIEAHLALKRQGGTLELAGIQAEVARTLSLLGVDQVIPVCPQADPGPAEAGSGCSTGCLPQYACALTDAGRVAGPGTWSGCRARRRRPPGSIRRRIRHPW
jgi:anti-anti-sigma factor